MARRTLSELLARPGRVIGTWSQCADADVIDMLGHARFDFTIIDCEHGAFGIETAVHLIRACEAADVTPLVRVPRGDLIAAGKALDAGAAGVLAPGVESAAEAGRWVAATRFQPLGSRGACPIVRSAAHSAQPWQAFTREQQGTGIIAMIESPAGVGNSEAICRSPGLAGVMAGPFDLSVSLGHEGDIDHAEVRSALARVVAAAQAASVPLFMPVFSGGQDALQSRMANWHQAGIRHFAVGADKIIMADALRRYRDWAREA